MTAKEMFENLGFKYKKYTTTFAYEKDDGNHQKFVHFNVNNRKYCTNVYHVDVELHKAIVKQMIELEWIDIEELEDLL